MSGWLLDGCLGKYVDMRRSSSGSQTVWDGLSAERRNTLKYENAWYFN